MNDASDGPRVFAIDYGQILKYQRGELSATDESASDDWLDAIEDAGFSPVRVPMSMLPEKDGEQVRLIPYPLIPRLFWLAPQADQSATPVPEDIWASPQQGSWSPGNQFGTPPPGFNWGHAIDQLGRVGTVITAGKWVWRLGKLVFEARA